MATLADLSVWIALACALAALAWAPRAALLIAALALLLALMQQIVTLAALPLLAAVALLAWLHRRGIAQRSAELALAAIAAGLFLHLFSGFLRVPQLDGAPIGPRSLPGAFSFNVDKALIPFVLLACAPSLFRARACPPRRALAWLALLAAVPLLLLAAVLLGGLGFERHLPDWLGRFMLANLFFVALAEEAFFRGYLQQRLRARLGGPTALLLSALLFGLAHAPGGALLVLFAALAGVIYGLAWHWSGRLWVSTLFHFALNITHLLFFTWPALQR